MDLIKESISFDYSDEDKKLFDTVQHDHWNNISAHYEKIKKRCLPEVYLPQSGTHKEWITARVNLHLSQSLFRLLYLVEAFRDASLTFNAPAAAALIKSIVEIPLHIGYMVWILSELRDFESIQKELSKLAWGNRDKRSGLTTSGKIQQKDLYMRSDEIIAKIFKDKDEASKIFEWLYKDSNATGHHNYEGRMLTGIQNGDTWNAGDRKKLFVFFSNKIFQFFMFCDSALGMTTILVKALDHYLEHIPDNYTKK